MLNRAIATAVPELARKMKGTKEFIATTTGHRGGKFGSLCVYNGHRLRHHHTPYFWYGITVHSLE